MRFTIPRIGLLLALLAALSGRARAAADGGPANLPGPPPAPLVTPGPASPGVPGGPAVPSSAPRPAEPTPLGAARVAGADLPEPEPAPLLEPEPEPAPLLEPEPEPAPLLLPDAAKPAATDVNLRSGSRGRAGAAWAGVAITLTLFTAGTVVGVLAQQRSDGLSSSTTQRIDGLAPIYDAAQRTAYTDLQSQGQTYNGAAIGCFVAGGVTALVSGILFWNATRRPGSDKQLTLRPAVSPRGGLVTLTGRF